MKYGLLRRLQAACLAGTLGLLALCSAALLSGQVAIVATEGVSMNPLYSEGDLVVVTRAPSYSIGDIAAYKLSDSYDVALHRIIGGNANGYVFKGDNNESIDPLTPRADELAGLAVLHIPQGGPWLERLTSPPVLGLIAFALIASGGTAASTRRPRRRRKEAAMSRHTSSTKRTVLAVSSLPPTLQTAAAATAVAGILATTIGVLAWSGPLEVPSTAEVENGTKMAFSYTAEVGPSPVYDGTTAVSPEPIFRKLANTVDVKFAYSGDPGSIAVVAELSTQDGWHSTVPLAAEKSFTESTYEGTARLDLETFQEKADAAAAATGMPASAVSIALVPQVTTAEGAEFKPELKLNLTPLQLTLVGGQESLTVTDTSTVQQTAVIPRTIGVGDVKVSAAAARFISAVLLFSALVATAVIITFARRSAPADEAAAIRRRYAALLVPVHPMPAPQGRPLIDVTSFATLAKLADRYGLLVLSWTRSDVETFVVQDESVTYRYRTGTNASAAAMDKLEASMEEDIVSISVRPTQL